jgi:hypothetical protein
MTGAVLDRPGTQQFELDGGLTLEELLNSALHEARTSGSTECPVCHARMSIARTSSTRAREAGAAFAAETGDAPAAEANDAFAVECGGCGSRLS